MNRIVRENYPASKLPEDLRPSSDPEARVVVTVETQDTAVETPPERRVTLEEIMARRRPPYRSKEEIDAQVRADRDEWDD
ncbi:hypothetical protein CCR97_14510 [Rhodoplanes elegans]|uniref:Uncharacterized protein n=1 Tax=Rhodoplanes elegans TaxID=29408 RepID=A0A327KR52_9BRAD|nr:hypothetical protein [Rhodoplanes elegans]MBK5959410.1 hypothetical protein [Rhodoplanes elegans]RAI37818.1 hypothetical protein CH338_14790 [Rhodoplanes elegans]